MSNNKQSSIDYLFERFYANEGMITTKQLEKAKEKHKEEIVDSYCDGRLSVISKKVISAEQYYNETFNTKEK